MNKSNANTRGLISLPKNWRVISVASLTTLGLAYGAGQPAQGEWWSLPKGKTRAEATKERPSESPNGFAATIQRLMNDAQQYAERGEYDKAIQLADRAAKIAEASSQVLGPSPKLSPEATAKYAQQLRAERDSLAKRTPANRVAPQVARQSVTAPPVSAPPVVAPKVAAPIDAAPGVVAISPMPQPRPATSPSRGSVEESIPNLSDPFFTERPAAEPPRAASVAKSTDDAGDSGFAFEMGLPPEPAPEIETAQKAVKFRRSIITRSIPELDDEDVGLSNLPGEDSAASQAKSAIVDMIESPVEVAIESETSEAVADSKEEMPLENAESESASMDVASTESETSPVPAPQEAKPSDDFDPFADELPPSPVAKTPTEGWEDEAFADELLLGSGSPKKTESAPLPDDSAASTAQNTEPPRAAAPFPEDEFPVHRVVQLRRRLETVTSLNPGLTLSNPSGSTSIADKTVSPESTNNKLPDSPKVASSATQSEDWMDEGLGEKSPSGAASSVAESTPAKRPMIRLREHRQMSEQVKTALLQQPVTPPEVAVASRDKKQNVGYSEPMLWRPATDSDPVLPSLSLEPVPDDKSKASRESAAKKLPPDLRDLARADGTDDSKVIQTASTSPVELQPIELSPDTLSSHGSSTSKPAATTSKTTSPKRPSTTTTVRKPTSQPSKPAPATVKTSQTASSKKERASHEVPREMFAAIEPLAKSLQLPVETTATLLGGAGLALLGLGMVLFRAAFRSRHS